MTSKRWTARIGTGVIVQQLRIRVDVLRCEVGEPVISKTPKQVEGGELSNRREQGRHWTVKICREVGTQEPKYPSVKRCDLAGGLKPMVDGLRNHRPQIPRPELVAASAQRCDPGVQAQRAVAQ